ncbi:MAG: MBL fold metallo-hydrolase [Paludibacteraceae bacterium]|nr:MBL fold metallo-hydrolase [Paludibacteraceae bacterium]
MDNSDLIFRCFGSGSSGNSYYLGTRQRGILIDAGLSARMIQRGLREMGLELSPYHIMGVLITHDHADHIRAVGTLGERVHIPIYTTALVHEGIDRNYGVREKLRTSRRFFERGQAWQLGDFLINTFGISHDSSAECLGYTITYGDQHFMIATDCGEPNPDMEAAVRASNHIVIEANHDEELLLNGPYPTYLKQRILSSKGHQSNDTCGRVLEQNWHEGLRNIWLCHLSQENNDPQVAYDTVAEHLRAIGVEPGRDVFMRPLDRLIPSPVYKLDNHILPTE